MTPIILIVLAVVAVLAGGFALVPGMASGGLADKRKKALRGEIPSPRVAESAKRQRDTRRRTISDAVKSQQVALEKRRRKPTLQMRLEQAGWKIRREAFIRNSVLIGLFIGGVAMFLEVPALFAFVFGVAGAYVLPTFWLKRATKKFQAKFLDEFPNAIETIVRGVKSGLPLNDSIRVVAKETKEPVRSEFARVLEQQSVGKNMHEAVDILFDRVPRSEVNFFVVVISVQQQAGGNLSEALTNLAHVLRNRKKMQGKVKAMSSEAKASAMIIGALPFLVAGLVSLVTPDYLLVLFTTTIGLFWLGVAVVMLSLGTFIMNRMIQFDV
ncbi:MAG: type II secretion system F family protein [Alphaproteobacteria bacterium]|nr:type II secretion system F family protein [Alphaproteobacteria bacterium]